MAVGVGVNVAVAVGVGEGVPAGVNVAVAVGVGEGVAAVAVGEAVGVGDALGLTVISVIDQPPAKLPMSPFPSSKTYNDQVPLGAPPLKVDKVAAYGPAGAGAGNVSAGA